MKKVKMILTESQYNRVILEQSNSIDSNDVLTINFDDNSKIKINVFEKKGSKLFFKFELDENGNILKEKGKAEEFLSKLRNEGFKDFNYGVVDMNDINVNANNTNNNKKQTKKNSLSSDELKHKRSLDLSEKKLTSLPDSIGNLKNLGELYLGNRLIRLPDSIRKQIKNYKERYEDGNKLTSLPNSIGNLKNLWRLWLQGNPITTKEIGRIEELLPNTKISF